MPQIIPVEEKHLQLHGSGLEYSPHRVIQAQRFASLAVGKDEIVRSECVLSAGEILVQPFDVRIVKSDCAIAVSVLGAFVAQSSGGIFIPGSADAKRLLLTVQVLDAELRVNLTDLDRLREEREELADGVVLFERLKPADAEIGVSIL